MAMFFHPVQQAFVDRWAVQCGFCTPSMILTAIAILNENPNADEDEIREGLHGNFMPLYRLCKNC